MEWKKLTYHWWFPVFPTQERMPFMQSKLWCHHTHCNSKLYVPTGLCHGWSDIWPNISLLICMKKFLDEINILLIILSKQMALLNIGGPHPINWRAENKSPGGNSLPSGLDWNTASAWVLILLDCLLELKTSSSHVSQAVGFALELEHWLSSLPAIDLGTSQASWLCELYPFNKSYSYVCEHMYKCICVFLNDIGICMYNFWFFWRTLIHGICNDW